MGNLSVMVGLSSDASVSPVLMAERKTKAMGNNAQIFTVRRLNLATIRAEYLEVCISEIGQAFPAPSRWACCKAAAKATGETPDKFARILERETATPDFPLMLLVGAIYSAKTQRQSMIRKFVDALTDGAAA